MADVLSLVLRKVITASLTDLLSVPQPVERTNKTYGDEEDIHNSSEGFCHSKNPFKQIGYSIPDSIHDFSNFPQN
ncbi:MAG: hypothetical protein ACK560_06005 [Bacteroidota bacterium]|jgi:hypothetical protein